MSSLNPTFPDVLHRAEILYPFRIPLLMSSLNPTFPDVLRRAEISCPFGASA
ncbi:hypothetical protein Barb4_02715 [Bacteroidales bacterium Barb4]|nr:hypothetical protein Barb4_02715 [Bacteroidales bacterium Barb4]